MRKKRIINNQIIIHSARVTIGSFVSLLFSILLFVFKEEILSF